MCSYRSDRLFDLRRDACILGTLSPMRWIVLTRRWRIHERQTSDTMTRVWEDEPVARTADEVLAGSAGAMNGPGEGVPTDPSQAFMRMNN
jgi:hypothetical protein